MSDAYTESRARALLKALRGLDLLGQKALEVAAAHVDRAYADGYADAITEGEAS